jgi:hypothetical protein
VQLRGQEAHGSSLGIHDARDNDHLRPCCGIARQQREQRFVFEHMSIWVVVVSGVQHAQLIDVDIGDCYPVPR